MIDGVKQNTEEGIIQLKEALYLGANVFRKFDGQTALEWARRLKNFKAEVYLRPVLPALTPKDFLKTIQKHKLDIPEEILNLKEYKAGRKTYEEYVDTYNHFTSPDRVEFSFDNGFAQGTLSYKMLYADESTTYNNDEHACSDTGGQRPVSIEECIHANQTLNIDRRNARLSEFNFEDRTLSQQPAGCIFDKDLMTIIWNWRDYDSLESIVIYV